METIEEFVQRTQGPLFPFSPGLYPWAYAHHYLRLETGRLPADLARLPSSPSLDETRDLIHLWCGLTGESVEDAARRLADAYLRRWGIDRTTPTRPSRRQKKPPASGDNPADGRTRRRSNSGQSGAKAASPAATKAAPAVAPAVAKAKPPAPRRSG